MRRIWRPLCPVLAAILVGTATAVVVGRAGEALAQPEECWEWVYVIDGQDVNGDPTYGWEWQNTCESAGRPGDSGGGPRTCHHSTRGEVPCHDPAWGWWSNAEECYASLLSPQPPAGDPLWVGNDPADGAVYLLRCPGDVLGSGAAQGAWSTRVAFLATAPGLPTVAQLAQRAIERLPLAAAEIGIAPSPDGVGLVGVPVWLWTRNPAATWGPVSVSIPGPITVTAQGNATQIQWDLGDGTAVVCDGPGEPYQDHHGAKQPSCGHVYSMPSLTQPDGRYQVTATTTWQVEWWVEPRGSGAEGEDFFLRESATSIQINELHVVTS